MKRRTKQRLKNDPYDLRIKAGRVLPRIDSMKNKIEIIRKQYPELDNALPHFKTIQTATDLLSQALRTRFSLDRF